MLELTDSLNDALHKDAVALLRGLRLLEAELADSLDERNEVSSALMIVKAAVWDRKLELVTDFCRNAKASAVSAAKVAVAQKSKQQSSKARENTTYSAKESLLIYRRSWARSWAT